MSFLQGFTGIFGMTMDVLDMKMFNFSLTFVSVLTKGVLYPAI